MVAIGCVLTGETSHDRHICDAVAHAHRHLIVHRDLTPANVLVTDDGQPKLLDFGIAKAVDAPGVEMTLALRLTPDFCAPEQLVGGAVTTATDVYALRVKERDAMQGELQKRGVGCGIHYPIPLHRTAPG